MREAYPCPLCGTLVLVIGAYNECPHCSHVRVIKQDGSWEDRGVSLHCQLCDAPIVAHTADTECSNCHNHVTFTSNKWYQWGRRHKCGICHRLIHHHSPEFQCDYCKAFVCFNRSSGKWEYHAVGSYMVEWLKGCAIVGATCIGMVMNNPELKSFGALLFLVMSGLTMAYPSLRRKSVIIGCIFSAVLVNLLVLWYHNGFFFSLLCTIGIFAGVWFLWNYYYPTKKPLPPDLTRYGKEDDDDDLPD